MLMMGDFCPFRSARTFHQKGPRFCKGFFLPQDVRAVRSCCADLPLGEDTPTPTLAFLGHGRAVHQSMVPPPPFVVPHPLSFPGGGGGGGRRNVGQGVGDRHLVNPKFFVAAHCVVVWVTVLWGTATCIPCTHGRTFCSLSLKWNLIAQPCFPLGQVSCSSASRGNLFWRRSLDIRSMVTPIAASLMTVMARPMMIVT